MYICIYDILAIFDQSWKKIEDRKVLFKLMLFQKKKQKVPVSIALSLAPLPRLYILRLLIIFDKLLIIQSIHFFITEENDSDYREYSLPYNWKKLGRRRQQNMVIWVVEFPKQVYKIRNVFGSN